MIDFNGGKILGDLTKLFETFLDNSKIIIDEPMKKHTSFKIGGNADIMLLPENLEEIKKCISVCEENSLNYYIMGNGTNLLIRDKGFRGVIIKLFKNYSNIAIEGNTIKAEAGATLSRIAKKVLENSLEGFEFAAGIPGTIGGGVCMNAGAYESELKDIVKSVTVIKNGEILTLENKECEFEYRNSRILKEKLVVLEVLIQLNEGIKEEIAKKMKDISKSRIEKQPLEYPSAGSTFKRPLNNFAGKLIMEAGLKGKNVGGAYISEKHCGFIINKGSATCSDVIELADIAYKTVKEKFNICLEKEVRVIGEE